MGGPPGAAPALTQPLPISSSGLPGVQERSQALHQDAARSAPRPGAGDRPRGWVLGLGVMGGRVGAGGRISPRQGNGLLSAGIVAVFESHRAKGITDMYSLHSWCGMAAFVLYLVQVRAGEPRHPWVGGGGTQGQGPQHPLTPLRPAVAPGVRFLPGPRRVLLAAQPLQAPAHLRRHRPLCPLHRHLLAGHHRDAALQHQVGERLGGGRINTSPQSPQKCCSSPSPAGQSLAPAWAEVLWLCSPPRVSVLLLLSHFQMMLHGGRILLSFFFAPGGECSKCCRLAAASCLQNPLGSLAGGHGDVPVP